VPEMGSPPMFMLNLQKEKGKKKKEKRKKKKEEKKREKVSQISVT
jgi:hypothetical protein